LLLKPDFLRTQNL